MPAGLFSSCINLGLDTIRFVIRVAVRIAEMVVLTRL